MKSLKPGDQVSGFLWYAECKQLAVEMIISFVPPANGQEMRIYHGLYLTNLFALLDLANDIFGPDVWSDWSTSLDGLGDQPGAENAKYLRDLRNAVVHRGFDISACGEVVNGSVCSLSPVIIPNRHGVHESVRPFTPLLRNAFTMCEEIIGPLIFRHFSPVITTMQAQSLESLQAQYLADVEVSTFMPEWGKPIARQMVGRIPFDEIRDQNLYRLRGLLDPCGNRSLRIS